MRRLVPIVWVGLAPGLAPAQERVPMALGQNNAFAGLLRAKGLRVNDLAAPLLHRRPDARPTLERLFQQSTSK